MNNDVAIIGIGMHAFGRTVGASGLDQGIVAVRAALRDAGVDWGQMQFAFGGSYAAGNADLMVSSMGLTGLQFINVVNGCATGSSALVSAYSAIRSGMHDIGVAVGFDKHDRGAFTPKSAATAGEYYGASGLAVTTQYFGMKINRYMHDYQIGSQTLAKVAAKAFRNGSNNPMAWRRRPMSEAEILDSQMLAYPLTQYMLCSPSEGGVALILCRADLAKNYTDTPIYLRGAAVRSRRFGSFEVLAPSIALEQQPGPSVDASAAAFAMAGISASEVQVAQVQDTEAGAEIMNMAETGLCAHGDQERLIHQGDTEINGRLPVNTDGGCLANGEPIGASGLRQVYESVLQLRGDAGVRQVPNNPSVAFTHVYGSPGISGACVLSR
jgi:acetyl-CoA C-acetyltransferase